MEDLRKKRSKQMLKEAMFQLLNEKPFLKITIVDICRKASLNRKTFYTNYETKEQLLEDCLYDFIGPFYRLMYRCKERDLHENVRLTIAFAKKERLVCQVIADNYLEVHVFRAGDRIALELQAEFGELQRPLPDGQELQRTYCAYQGWATLLWILKHLDMPEEVLCDKVARNLVYYFQTYNKAYSQLYRGEHI